MSEFGGTFGRVTGLVRARQVRWYRGKSLGYLVFAALAAAVCFVLGIWDPVGYGVGSVFLLLFVAVLASDFVAGIGVGADGILVRAAYGRTRRVPWTEVQRFDLRLRAGRGGPTCQIVVIRTDGTRMTTGVSSIGSRAIQRMKDQTFRDLEAARLEANQRLGLAS
jgi:hypothetical protein